MSKETDSNLTIADVDIPRGTRKRIEIKVSKLFDYTEMVIPVEVVRGRYDGPILFVSAAIHGDELNGVEIIKRLLARKGIGRSMNGTLIAVPIVNVFGFNNNSRYLPDRRDLNRCFPGSPNGSLGGQMAYTFMKQIVEKATHGIDLHTAAIHRNNLPQIRAQLDDPETAKLAKAFGVPVAINASVRDGSLRQAAAEKGIPMLLFEGGEALRFQENVIKRGVSGILSVMRDIGMLKSSRARKSQDSSSVFFAAASQWIRAPHSGAIRMRKKIGSRVHKGELLGTLSDPYGDATVPVISDREGIIIGMTMIPLVNQGDALFNIATFADSGAVVDQIEEWEEKENMSPTP